MSQQKHSENLSRRGFLKSAAVTGGAATVATLGPQVQADVVEQTGADNQKQASSKGYRETAHIREYYEKARF